MKGFNNFYFFLIILIEKVLTTCKIPIILVPAGQILF